MDGFLAGLLVLCIIAIGVTVGIKLMNRAGAGGVGSGGEQQGDAISRTARERTRRI